MSNIKSTLKERGSRYGSFEDNARITQSLCDIMLIVKFSLVFVANTHFVPENRNVFVGNVASPFILLAHTH